MYHSYMTEQIDEAGAVRNEKDEPVTKDFLGLTKQARRDERECTTRT